jgi:hypothetical protein
MAFMLKKFGFCRYKRRLMKKKRLLGFSTRPIPRKTTTTTTTLQ